MAALTLAMVLVIQHTQARHQRAAQANKFAEAFLRGQPRKATIATTLFRDRIEQFKS